MNRVAIILAVSVVCMGNLAPAQVSPNEPQTSAKSQTRNTGSATTTTLSISPPSATLGAVVTLTATVIPGTPTGKVTFYDGANVLGVAPLSNNTATFATIALGAGSHALVAYYQGNGSFNPSSSTAQPLNVVAGAGGAFVPDGVSPVTGADPVSIAFGDFNGDGYADLVTANENSNNVTVMLGNGQGSFLAGVNYAAGVNPIAVAVADINGDGFPDIVVANQGSSTITVLLGKGDGTFPTLETFNTNPGPHSLVIADFNGDGLPDLAVTSTNSAKVGIMLNTSPTTFTKPVYYTLPEIPRGLVAGDFNGDGKVDLAIVNSGGGVNNVSILLGNGDGTLQAPVSYPVGNGPVGVGTADFNHDGHLDLAVLNSADSTVGILLGIGDGTFASQVTYATAGGPSSVAISDFNGDGIPDLAIADNAVPLVSVLLGNGDGTFQAASKVSVGNGPRSIVAAAFNVLANADIADLAVANGTDGTVTVLIGEAGTTTSLSVAPNPATPGATVTLTANVSPMTATGNVTFYITVNKVATPLGPAIPLAAGTAVMTTTTLPVGTDSLSAIYTGNLPSSTSTTVAEKIEQSTSTALVVTPLTSTLGTQITLTANVTPPSATGKVTFYQGVNIVGQTLLKSGQAVITTVALPTGVDNLTAQYSGDVNNLPSVSNLVVETVTANASGGFQPPANYNVGSGPDALVLGDFNRDGLLDIAVANYSSGNVTVVPGEGLGFFGAGITTPVGSNPKGMAKGDFNADGNLDLAVTNYGGATVSILLGNGNNTFLAGPILQTGVNPQGIAVADFNGDGNADLVVVDTSANEISILLGNGDGTFQPASFIPVGTGIVNVSTGDFNGDGKVDLAVVGAGGAYVMLGNGDGTFATAVAYAAGSFPAAIGVGDLAGNGHLDLVVVNSGAGSNSISVLIGNGDGTFQPAMNYPVGIFPVAVTLADFNGDGKLDVVVANEAGTIPNQTQNTVSLLLGNGDGTLQPALSFLAGLGPIALASGSFDPLGQSDLAVADYSSNSVSVLLALQTAAVTLTATPNPDTTGGPITLTATMTPTYPTGTVTFMDGTNSLGIFTLINGVASDTGVTLTAGNHNLTAVYNGSTAYGPATSPVVVESVSQAATTTSLSASPSPAKFAQAVTITATVSSPGATGEVTFYDGDTIIGDAQVSNGAATFTTTQLPSGTRNLSARYTGDVNYLGSASPSSQLLVVAQHGFGLSVPGVFSAGTSPTSVAIGDFNSDGKLDLAVANQGVSILLGNGNGTFQGAANLTAGTAPSQVVTGDFNLDGKVDLAVTNSTSSNLSIILGNGDGTFQPAVNYPTGLSPSSLAVADFNNDGKPDVVVANRGAGGISIFLGNGDGTLGAAQTVTVGATDVYVTAGDFNGDGKPDVAVADLTGNVAWILLGNGDGTFQSPVSFAVGANPAGIATGDFNFDGKLDLAVVNQGSGDVTILLGNNDGTFHASGPYPAGAGADSIAVGDFNGDGLPDLVVAAGGAGAADVLLGNGDGSFQAPVAFTGLSNPTAVVVGNFNGDGAAQVAIADNGANSVAVMLDAPASLTAVAGSGQSTPVGASFATALQVQTSGFGVPVAGVTVVFSAPASGPSGIFSGFGTSVTLVTGQNGIATAPIFNANSQSGAYQVTAASGSGSVAFNLTNTASSCSFTAGSGPVFVASAGGQVILPVTASLSSCVWSAGSDSSWITLGASGGTGTGSVAVNIAANTTGASRSGNILLAGQLIPVTEDATTQVFADVPPSAFYFDAVNLLYAKGITSGCSVNPLDYCPTQSVTRDQMAVFLVRAAYGSDNFTLISSTPYFTDVPSSYWAFKWIQKLYELGITTGCGPQLYCPTETVTRDQMAVFLIRIRYGAQTPVDYNSTPYFTDVPANYWAFDWIQRLRQDQITSGCTTTTYCPGNPVTRGDMAIFVMRAGFNQLLPTGTPLISQSSPTQVALGQTVTLTVTGVNTHFVQGETIISPLPGITFGSPTVTSPTALTVQVTVTSSASEQPEPVFVVTGLEEAVLPNGLVIP